MISAFKHSGHNCIVLISRHTAGNNDAAVVERVRITISHFTNQFFNEYIIASLSNHRKLVPAQPENRASLKGVADDLAGIPQVLIARPMPGCIIDFFQIIHIQNHDGKRRLGMRCNLTVQLCFRS